MENPKDNQEDLAREHIRKLTQPIFEKVLKEDLTDSMTTMPPTYKALFRPNNYRREIRVKNWGNSAGNSAKRKGHNKLAFIRLDNVTLQLGRETIVAIWKQKQVNGYKQTWYYESQNIDEVNDAIENRINLIEKELDEVMLGWALTNGVETEGTITWNRYENWIKGEDFIDSLPRDLIIHDTVFKKVYAEGIEFIGGKGKHPLATTKNYLKNRAVENVMPEVMTVLNSFVDEFKKSTELMIQSQDRMRLEALNPLTEQIVTHLAVQHKTLQVQESNLEVNKALKEGIGELKQTVSDIKDETAKRLRKERIREIKEEWGW